MTYLRFFTGLLVVVLALWTIAGEQLSGASADATINARVVTLRSPVAGDLAVPERELGSRVAVDEVVASVSDRLVDGVRLDDLTMEAALEEAGLARQVAQVAQTKALVLVLTQRRDDYRSERKAEIQVRLTHARERLAALEDGAATGTAAGDKKAGRGPLEPGPLGVEVSQARENVELLESSLGAAEAGIFVGDGNGDVPYSEQRLAELQGELVSEEAARAEAEARVAAVTARRDAERLRVNKATGGEITSSVDGVYWEVLAADGENVQRGDPVARLVDCGSIFVTASVTESVYNRLSVGEEVTFRPRGGSRNFAGSVARLAGTGAATVYRDLAVAPSQKHLERFDVLVDVPDLATAEGFGCAVGRTGRVFFEARPLDWLRSFWN